jgi:methionyl-tRNA synthetase
MLNLSKLNWDDAKNYNLTTGKQINKATLLFTKIEDEKINDQIAKLKS